MGNKRKAITLLDKMNIISKLKAGCANAQICREYNLPKSTVSTIWAKREHYSTAQGKNVSKIKKLRPPVRNDVDQALLKWFTLKRTENVPISGPLLETKLQEFARVSASNEAHNQVKCTKSWVDRFKRRYNITSGKIHGEAASVSTKVTQDWLTTVWPALRRRYEDRNIFNGDETGLFYRLTPDRTLKFKGETCAGGKHSKERITVFICANMDGSEKRPLLVIGKSKTPRCFRTCAKLPVTYMANKKAWITSDIFEQLLRDWDEELSRNKRNVLLLIDNCPAHPQVKNLKWIELVFLPPNVTATLQPMDQGVIRCIKSYYRKTLLIKMLNAIDQNADLKITLLDALFMLRTAWRQVSSKTIANCFRHAGLFSETGFCAEDELPLAEWILLNQTNDESKNEDTNLAEWARENNITDFVHFDLDEYSNIDHDLRVTEFPSDGDIVASVLDSEQEDFADNEDEEVPIPMNIVPTFAEAMTAIKTLSLYIQFTSPQEECCLSACHTLEKKLEEEVLNKRRKQKKITDYF